jgi:hypothetical protein
MVMEGIITGRIWSQVKEVIDSQASKTAAVAYVSKGTPISFGDGDTLICDATDQAIRSGQTDADTLRDFLRNGAKLFSCENLHAKVIVSGDVTVIGSANLSASAETVLIEASLVTRRARVRSQALALIHDIRTKAVPIDADFVRRICSLPVDRRGMVTGTPTRISIAELGTRFWVVNVSPFDVRDEEEQKSVEEGERQARAVLGDPEADVDWVRFTGQSKFRRMARVGDSVVVIWKANRRINVVGPRAILSVSEQDQGRWKRFFLGGEAGRFSWTEFERELKKVGLGDKVRKGSVRELGVREADLIEAIFR